MLDRRLLDKTAMQAFYAACTPDQREEIRACINAFERGDCGLHELAVTVQALHDAIVGTGGRETDTPSEYDVDATVEADFEPAPEPGEFEPVPESLFQMPASAAAKLEGQRAHTDRRYPT